MKAKGTQTLVQELYDSMLESLENGETAEVIQKDQSKAYNVCDHPILIAKMQHLGFNRKAINIMSSYLDQRRQYIVVDSFASPLLVGPQSMTQGPSLSCMLYIIYIFDITGIFHDKTHSPEETIECSNSINTSTPSMSRICSSTTSKTFVDDNIILTKAKHGASIQEAILSVITKLDYYTNANLLSLNPKKLLVMVLTKDKQTRADFCAPVGRKVLLPQPTLTILGNVIADDLSWNKHVQLIVIPALAN